MDDVNKRLGQLFERLNHNDISGQACDKLLQLCTGVWCCRVGLQFLPNTSAVAQLWTLAILPRLVTCKYAPDSIIIANNVFT